MTHLEAPDDVLRPLVSLYFTLGFPDTQIPQLVMRQLDRQQYGLRRVFYTVRRRRKEWGLKSARKLAADWTFIQPLYEELRAKFPNMGARAMVSNLRLRWGVKVPEAFLGRLFQLVEPDQLRRPIRKKFRRKRWWSAGVMDILAFDQHDKWKRFGLWLHIGLDPFAGRIAWLRIWWTNRNPRLITSYYLNACREVGGIPLITQSDPGSENYGVANCQTVTRQRLDPTLRGTLQHRWMNKNAMNIKPEAAWSLLRRFFTMGFEDKLEENERLLDMNDPLQKLLFRWLAIPMLQKELDVYANIFNSTKRRADKHKILPRGIPNMIASTPEDFGARDYKACTLATPPPCQLNRDWAPPSDPVFELVPPGFEAEVSQLYLALGSPEVTIHSLWTVYSALLQAFRQAGVDDIRDEMEAADDHFEYSIDLLEGEDLRPGDGLEWGVPYIGGLAVLPAEPAAGEEEEDDEEDEEDDEDGPEQFAFQDARQFAEYAVFTDEEDDEE
ncbi:hypothetical protein C8R47DRAFT_968620 [Mycena vitilis]|nr:hypothetical protein C8R47DRAFT_968620 [Mycena vitilis]